MLGHYRGKISRGDAMRVLPAAAALLLLFIGAPEPAQAAWSTDPQQNTPVCLAPGNQDFPIMAPDGQGGAFIVFRDMRDSVTALSEVYAQHLDSQGNTLWPALGVPVARMPGDQFASGVVTDQVGGAFIAFTTQPAPPFSIFWVKLQHLDSQGTAMWGDSGMAVSSSGQQINGRLLADGNGGTFISWSSGNRVMAQHVDANGTALWTPNGVQVVSSSIPQGQQMVSDGSGGILLTWMDYRVINASDIYAQRLDAAGVPQWTTNGVPLSTEPGQQLDLRMCSDGVGGAIATWYTYPSYRVFVRRIAGTGVPMWTVNGVRVSTDELFQETPEIASDGSGGAIIAWEDARAGPSDVYIQRVNASGMRLWGDGGVPLCTAPGSQQRFQLIADGESGAMAVWADERSPGTPGIYAQRVGSDGSPRWTVDGILVSDAPGSFKLPALIPSGSGAIAAFHGYRGSSFDIYAQQFSEDGQLGIVVTGVEPREQSQAPSGISVVPLPASDHVTLSFEPRAPGPFDFSVFDVQGRRLHSLRGRTDGTGVHHVRWDLRDEAGHRVATGVYLARVTRGQEILRARIVVAE